MRFLYYQFQFVRWISSVSIVVRMFVGRNLGSIVVINVVHIFNLGVPRSDRFPRNKRSS
jgi:hypothetical protein